MIRFISPIIIVRFGKIDAGRIGGFYQLDWYLSEKLDGKHNNKRFFDIFYIIKTTSHVNKCWLNIWSNEVFIIKGEKVWLRFERVNKLFLGYKKFMIPSLSVYPNLKQWKNYLKTSDEKLLKPFNNRLLSILKNKNPNIKISNNNILSELGIEKNVKYICFHARDSAYLNKVKPEIDWSYHNYRDSSIENCILAASKMTEYGYYAIRMGAHVNNSLNTSNHKIIDYASSKKRSDYSDIILGSNCLFFICSDGGISIIPEAFRIPTVYINWTPILRISTWVLNGIFIFKNFYLESEKRYLKFSEIMNLDFGGTDTYQIFKNLNITLEENSEEEILDVTMEMELRLKGKWKTTREDEALQNKFWLLFGQTKMRSSNLRIGSNFLRKNKHLI